MFSFCAISVCNLGCILHYIVARIHCGYIYIIFFGPGRTKPHLEIAFAAKRRMSCSIPFRSSNCICSIYIYTDQYSVYYVGEFSLYLPAIM